MILAAGNPVTTPALSGRRRLHVEPSALVLAGLTALIVAAGWLVAFRFMPEPHSDWLYYWTAAGDAARYERGGIGLWLLAVPKLLGIGPMVSALLLDTLAALVLAGVAVRVDPFRGRPLAFVVVAYLAAMIPYFGIVQLDLLSAAAIAAGIACVRPGVAHVARGLLVGAALIAVGVSTKPQYALVLWAMLALAVPLALLCRRAVRRADLLLPACLLAGSIAGFAADSGLRAIAGRSESMRTVSAVTLYGGLLVSEEQGACGYWSPRAGEAAKADLDRPLAVAVVDRLRAQPAAHWLAVMRCKVPQIVKAPPFALYWLVESPNIWARIEASPDRDALKARYYRATGIERRAYGWLRIAAWSTVIAAAIVGWRRNRRFAGFLPLLWVLAFWSVHLVFEIQGRYFLGLFVLAPILSGLVCRDVVARHRAPLSEGNPAA